MTKRKTLKQLSNSVCVNFILARGQIEKGNKACFAFYCGEAYGLQSMGGWTKEQEREQTDAWFRMKEEMESRGWKEPWSDK